MIEFLILCVCAYLGFRVGFHVASKEVVNVRAKLKTMIKSLDECKATRDLYYSEILSYEKQVEKLTRHVDFLNKENSDSVYEINSLKTALEECRDPNGDRNDTL